MEIAGSLGIDIVEEDTNPNYLTAHLNQICQARSPKAAPP